MQSEPAKTFRCSVIIPVRNGAESIGRCLTALREQTIRNSEFEIIVVDDGSTDATVDVATSFGVRVLQQPPSGPAAARNRGLATAAGPIVLFTDADCEPLPDWVEQMLEPIETDGASGAKGSYLTRQTAPVARFVQIEYEDKYRHMARFRDIDFIDTYSAAFTKEVFDRVGGYDTAFSNASVEDQEFSFRVAKAGYKMRFQPTARVYHTHAASIGHYFRKKFKIGYWKVRVVRLHPEKIVADSHTPQLLKVQILLAGALLTALLGSIVPGWRIAMLAITLGVLVAFILTTVKMAATAWSIDRRVALLTPLFLLTRSIALGLGLVAGAFAAFFANHRSPSPAISPPSPLNPK